MSFLSETIDASVHENIINFCKYSVHGQSKKELLFKALLYSWAVYGGWALGKISINFITKQLKK